LKGHWPLPVEFGHVPTQAPIYFHKAQIEMLRGDDDQALRRSAFQEAANVVVLIPTHARAAS
jgi:hypothetical protein